jgi:hypothetical protein
MRVLTLGMAHDQPYSYYSTGHTSGEHWNREYLGSIYHGIVSRLIGTL